MAAIPVVLNGTFTTDTGSVNGVFNGTLAYSDRGVGGGPIVPDGKPPGIWGGPIDPYPGHPLPEPPGKPPTEPPADGESKPPPEGGGWGYWAEDVNSWVYKPRPGVDPEPKG